MTIHPNLLIGGAPKCGTTALANYLRTHPNVFFSPVKEPFYWASDIPEMRASEGIETSQQYGKLFDAATAEHRVVGEASTIYLYSENAIRDALAFNPDMKFVFMIRRPSDVAHAFHMQMCFHEAESEPSFEVAWRLQEGRRRSQSMIAKRCKSPKLLQYASVAALGSQLERAFELVPQENLHVILFDEFVSDTLGCYEQTLRFLGLPSDGRTEFPKDNAAMKSKSVRVTRMLRSGPARKATLFLKSRLTDSSFVFRSARWAKHALMFRLSKRAPLTEDFRKELRDYFVPEIEKLERLLDQDLSHWKND